jgi:histone H3/H4
LVIKIPIALIRRITKENAPDFRISANALERLQDIGTDFLRITIGDCRKLAEHSDRITIMEKDVILATE